MTRLRRSSDLRRGRQDDRGSGTLLVLALAALGGSLALLLAALSVTLAAGQRAKAAADLAALAAASPVPAGRPPDCRRAGAVAAAQHARLMTCTPLADGSVVVAVRVAVSPAGRLPAVLAPWAVGRARAGPAPAGADAGVGAGEPPGGVRAAPASSGGLGEQNVQQDGGPALVERLVPVAALRRLDARWAAGVAGAVLEHRTRRPQPGGSGAVAALGEAGATRVPVVHEDRGLPRVGVQRRREPSDVPAIARREQRQQPDGGVLGGMRRPGDVSRGEARRGEGLLGQRPPDRTCPQGPRRQVERGLTQHPAAAQVLADVGDDSGGHVDASQRQHRLAPFAPLALAAAPARR